MPLSAPEAESAVRAAIDALRRGDAAEARRLVQSVIDEGSPLPPPWFLLAQACRQLGDRSDEEAALDQVLAAQPANLGALIMKGDCRIEAEDHRAATSFYTAALRAGRSTEQIPPLLAAELQRVEGLVRGMEGLFEEQIEDRLTASGVTPARRSRRFQESLDIMLGRRRVYLQEPNSFYFPGLPQIQFYERSDFPWLAQIEAATPAIRAELERVLEQDRDFAPYVEAPPNRPRPPNPLLGDPSWGAFYLWKSGALVEENAARCPATVEALRHAPMPRIEGRSPIALFSLLRPGTHIAPHNGLLNTRLICHLPIIAPSNCRLRVGNETRTWEEGKALIFDDSIEHEAWNDGDSTRVVLLFEIWRPEIDEEERRALTVMFEGIGAYGVEADQG